MSAAKQQSPKYWLINESVENWETDKLYGFKFFGLPANRRLLAEQIAVGDVLITYVSSGISAFADARRAEGKVTGRRPIIEDYDRTYPIIVATRPLVWLERQDWIKIHELTKRLSFTRGKKDWRQTMRSSIRAMHESDAKLVLSRLQRITAKQPT